MSRRTIARAVGGLLLAAAVAMPASAADITLKASHQFPGGKGDVRDEMVQIIAREVAAANVGLEIKVYPASQLGDWVEVGLDWLLDAAAGFFAVVRAIMLGANDGLQVAFRPRIALDPYSTDIPGTYICSAATPPGAGVRGMPGAWTAHAVLEDQRV